MRPPVTSCLSCLTALLVLPVAPVSAQVGAHPDVLDPNLATATELQAAGLGEDVAAALVASRPFLDMTQVDTLLAESLSEETRRELYPKLFLPIDLNQASRTEIGLVPGMGPRMTHEFEEYRPYRGLAEFHREIGKYVDDEELARLAQFVFVPLDPNKTTREGFMTLSGVDESDWKALVSGRPYGSLESLRAALAKHRDPSTASWMIRYFSLPGDE